MSSLLKALLDKRLSMSMEDEQKDPETNGTEETVPKGDDKAAVGDGGSTPDGSEAGSEEENEQAGTGEGEAAGAAEGTEGGEATEGAEGGEAAEGGEGAEGAEASEGGEGAEAGAGEAAGGDDEGGVEFEDEDDDEDEFEEEEFEETSDALSETQKADLALVNLITNVRETLADGGLSGREAAMVADRAGAILGKIEMEPSPTPAQECFGSFGDRRNNTDLTLEALEEDKRAVEEKKSGLIERIMKFIRELWNSLFGNKQVFQRQVTAAAERAVKIEGNVEVTIKGQEGYVAGFAAMVGRDKFSCADLAGAINQLTAEVNGLVSKFTSIAGDDDCPEDFVEDFVKSTRVLSKVGFTRETYNEATKEYTNHDVVISVNSEQQKAMLGKFGAAFQQAENLMTRTESTARRACAAGNNKQLQEVLGVLRMFGNIAKSGPTLAIRLAVGNKDAA